jgi:flagellar basal body-associated protein FliL
MAEEEAREQQPAGKSKVASLVPKVLIAMAVIALQAVVSFVAVKEFGLVRPQPTVAVQAKKAEPGSIVREFGDVYLVEDIIVNPAGSSGRRFLNATVALVYSGKVGSELEKRNVQIRDIMLQTLGSYPIEILSNPAFRDSLRSEILHKVNGVLTTGKVSGVYFSSYVMQ